MPVESPELIQQLRQASRQMVRELGFMQSTLAATDYPPSAVHALLEIGQGHALTAGDLVTLLGLEKSSVSRLVRKLVDAGEISEQADARDARAKRLQLTAQGRQTLSGIDRFAQAQVAAALAHLSADQRRRASTGIADYARALRAVRLGEAPEPPECWSIARGYRPGVIGRIAEMHARYYADLAGFGQPFESLVARDMAELMGRLHNPRNEVWVALRGTQIVGSIAIDGEGEGDEAILRCFILDDAARGQGLGRRLLVEALAFCDQWGFAATRLWTFKGLDAARTLYEQQGFVLVQEQVGEQWGAAVTEQCFVRAGRVERDGTR
ncbi:GNAT family N-acetyltransferase [Pseudomonas chlororaphis]|uniref:bifunctional helix-turn-helix transcriptional regulator/GNAT family N-acetyltransferase n=1 Tax=Pseudomonas chlororaphis TaxID=587753 RepID=UPI00209B692E|nr:bifunctional helix-turn-helix transcriptional regulator/GNAT family N-acetyltransferase [Pseudomonas chlororaphis]MCO7573437.1 GNAT family N-acetyltransferase [Pseudomonas chlororaphis]MCO7591169.1 GNAT family N-acetyltransferase [Pseudomonas chlororaphis]